MSNLPLRLLIHRGVTTMLIRLYGTKVCCWNLLAKLENTMVAVCPTFSPIGHLKEELWV